MTTASKKFFSQLKELCRVHGVEIAAGSTFWVTGENRDQMQRHGVVNHLEVSMHPPDTQKNIIEITGRDSFIELVDLSNTRWHERHHSAAFNILKTDGEPKMDTI